mmetsp:Transcript_68041/g.199814  ORF Transcript_68041/g.199814 Transcript_68041/m.199814 type:complete len:363 (+) Transcript_68041:50-1138(+)
MSCGIFQIPDDSSSEAGSEEQELDEELGDPKEAALREKVRAWISPKTPHFFRHGGQRLHVRHWLPAGAIQGSVVYIHGLNGHVNRPTLGELGVALQQQGFAVLTFDLPGNGYSDGLRSYVEDFESFFDAVLCFVRLALGESKDPDPEEADLGLAPAVKRQLLSRPYFIMGESMGGMLAMYSSLRLEESSPPWLDRYRGTILSAPALAVDTPSPAVICFLQNIVVPLAKERLMPEGVSKSSKPDPKLIARNPERTEIMELDDIKRFPGVALGWQDKMRWATASAFATIYSGIEGDMAEVDFPMIVLHDPDDAICKCSGSERLVELATSSDKEFIKKPGALHDIFANEFEWALGQVLPWMLARL